MGNEWKNYIVQTRWVTDSSGKEHFYQIPPSWKLELLIWDIFTDLDDPSQDLSSLINNYDYALQAVSLILDLKPEVIEESFTIDVIMAVFSEVWDCIAPTEEEVKGIITTKIGKVSDEFTMDQCLAMFAVECGWEPARVLEMPKMQVVPLTEAISDYVAQRMRFQAAIHGVDVDEGAKDAVSTQIEDEGYWRDLSKELPVEVK